MAPLSASASDRDTKKVSPPESVLTLRKVPPLRLSPALNSSPYLRKYLPPVRDSSVLLAEMQISCKYSEAINSMNFSARRQVFQFFPKLPLP